MGASDQHTADSGAGGVGRQRGSEEEVVIIIALLLINLVLMLWSIGKVKEVTRSGKVD